jgi:hypothetical protein
VDCRNCGEPVDPQRVELGYDYCLQDECQQKCMKRVLLASVGVNKAADHYLRAEEILPPPTAPTRVSHDDGDDEPPAAGVSRPTRSRPPAQRRVKSTVETLREREAELDDALRLGYERFCRGEITAREMDLEHDRLVRAFNQVVRQQNIRYRSLLRRTRSIGP